MVFSAVEGSIQILGTVSGTDLTPAALYEPTHGLRIFVDNPSPPVTINNIYVGGAVPPNAILGADGITVTSGTSTTTITGFRSELISASGSLQNQINNFTVPDTSKALIGTNGNTIISGSNTITIQGFRPEFLLASGSLQTQITTNTNAIANLDATYATDAQLAAVSGTLHSEIISLNVDEVEPAITGSDGITITSGTSTTNVAGFRNEFVSASGSLQNQINAISPDKVEPAIIGTNGITVTSGSNTTTLTGFRSEFINASGSLQSQITTNTNAIANLDATYATDAQVATISGFLQTQIDAVEASDVDSVNGVVGAVLIAATGYSTTATLGQTITINTPVPNALVGGSNITITSGTNVISISAGGQNAITGSDGITVSSGSSTTNIAGFRTEFVNASGSLQNQITTNTNAIANLDATYATDAQLAAVSGSLHGEIISLNVDEVEPAITGTDGITITSGTNTTNVAGFRTEFVAASGFIQTQINNLDATYATDAQLASVSGHLQTQIDVANADVSSLNGLQGAITLAGTNIGVSSASQTITISAPVPNALVSAGNITIASGTNTTSISAGVPNALIAGSNVTITSGTNTTTITAAQPPAIVAGQNIVVTSGSNTITVAATTASANALIGGSNITIISGTNTTTIVGAQPPALTSAGNLTITSGTNQIFLSAGKENAIIAGSNIQVISGTNTTTIVSSQPPAIVGGGDIQVVSGSNTIRITDNNRAIISGDNFINVVSGTNTITITPDAIVSSSANLTVTSGTDVLTLGFSTTPSFTSVSATTITGTTGQYAGQMSAQSGLFSTALTVSGIPVRIDAKDIGEVRMRRTGNGTWEVMLPDGSLLNITASTTDGLQEAINYAITNGWDLDVFGGGITSAGSDLSVINCTTAIAVPPVQKCTIRIRSATINFTPAVTADAFVFDSCMMMHFMLEGGQIVYFGNNAAVAIRPTTQVPLDHIVTFVDSRIHINSIAVVSGTNGKGVDFDSTNGPITHSFFEFIEVNGGSGFGQHGLNIRMTTHGFIGNILRCPHLHQWTGSSLRVGDSASNTVYGNTFNVVAAPNGTNSIGIEVWGQDNGINAALLVNEGTLATGVVCKTGAARNTFNIVRNDATTAFVDVGGNAQAGFFGTSAGVSVSGSSATFAGAVTAQSSIFSTTMQAATVTGTTLQVGGTISAGTGNFSQNLTLNNGQLRVNTPTNAVNTQSALRINGYSPSIELIDKDSVQNYYIGIDDNVANQFYLGAGYGPNQGVLPNLVISGTDQMSFCAAGPFGSTFNFDSPNRDTIVTFRRDSTPLGGAQGELLAVFKHYSGGKNIGPDPIIAGMAYRGGVTTPSGVQSGDPLFIVDGRGFDGSVESDTAAQVGFYTTQNWTTTAHGAEVRMYATPKGSVVPTQVVTVGNTGMTVIGSGTFTTVTGTTGQFAGALSSQSATFGPGNINISGTLLLNNAIGGGAGSKYIGGGGAYGSNNDIAFNVKTGQGYEWNVNNVTVALLDAGATFSATFDAGGRMTVPTYSGTAGQFAGTVSAQTTTAQSVSGTNGFFGKTFILANQNQVPGKPQFGTLAISGTALKFYDGNTWRSVNVT